MSKEPTTHELKIIPCYFHDVKHGYKTFEIRRGDRDFKAGDILILKEYKQYEERGGCFAKYSGKSVAVKVTYVTNLSGVAGLNGFVGMSIERI